MHQAHVSAPVGTRAYRGLFGSRSAACCVVARPASEISLRAPSVSLASTLARPVPSRRSRIAAPTIFAASFSSTRPAGITGEYAFATPSASRCFSYHSSAADDATSADSSTRRGYS